MKVKIEMKITVLEGEEAGRVFKEKPFIGFTDSEVTEIGIIEHLKVDWGYFHQISPRGISYRANKCQEKKE